MYYHGQPTLKHQQPKHVVFMDIRSTNLAYQNAIKLLRRRFQILLAGPAFHTPVSSSSVKPITYHKYPLENDYDMETRAKDGPVVHDNDVSRMWICFSDESAQEIAFWEETFVLQLREIVEDMVARLILDSGQLDALYQRDTKQHQYREEDILRRLHVFTSTAYRKKLTVDVLMMIQAMKSTHQFYGNKHKLFSATGQLDHYIIEFLKTRECFSSSTYPHPEILLSLSPSRFESGIFRIEAKIECVHLGYCLWIFPTPRWKGLCFQSNPLS